MSRDSILPARRAQRLGRACATRVRRAAARARRRSQPITPALIEAAKKEGKLVFYTAMDLQLAERSARRSRRNIPASRCASSAPAPSACSSASARNIDSNIHAVDVVNTADQSHCIIWKRNGWLAPYLPEEVAKYYDKAYYDPDALHVTTRVLVSPFGYNTNLVKAEDAPKSFADLLDPKWAGKMVKAHPAYSGTIMNATFQIARDLGWEYLEKLAKQRIMQVQSATDTPKKIALGERAIMIDGAGYLVIQRQGGRPAGRRDLSGRRHAARHQPERGVQGGAQSERRAPVPELAALARGPADSGRLSRASIRRMRRPSRSRASASSPTSS